MRALFIAIFAACFVAPGLAADAIISFDGSFGGFIRLGTSRDQVQALGPDGAETATPEETRVPSTWYYFDSRTIRVRVCADDQKVGAINAGVSPVTYKYVTEDGVRIGNTLEQVSNVYGPRLQEMAGSEGAIWYVDAPRGSNRITFGFGEQGDMRWVALGALRENGWTCGVSP